MRNEFVGIINLLELDHPSANSLRQRVLSFCNSGPDARRLLRELRHEEKEDNQPYRSALFALFIACIHDELGNRKAAFSSMANALFGFRKLGNDFNEAMAHWLAGLLYKIYGENHLAIPELDEAIRILERCIELGDGCNYEKKNQCESNICDIKETLMTLDAKREDGVVSRLSSSIKKFQQVARLVFGVYDIAHASRVGKFVFDDSIIAKVEVEQVIIDNISHHIYNCREGTEITLIPNGIYRWLKVAGKSMNLAKPVPIEPDDFVLVDVNLPPMIGNIVFVRLENPPTPAERAGIIKRYSNDGFKSESTESIMPITSTDADIRGVVIAVAKREKEPHHITPKSQSSRVNRKSRSQAQSSAKDALYQDLLVLAKGDEELAQRLINYEINHSPGISQKEAIERAILHWRRQL